MAASFVGVFPLTVLLTVLCMQQGFHCTTVITENDKGEETNGIARPGDHIRIICKDVAANGTFFMYKDQPGADAPVLLVVNSFILDNTASSRFEIEVVTEGETKSFILKSKVGVQLTDSGLYGCKDSGGSGTTIDRASVEWTTITVVDWWREMFLYGVNKEHIHDVQKYHVELFDAEQYQIEENEEFYFRCMAIGSNPAANIQITFNDKDITDQFERTEELDRPIMEKAPVSDVHSIYNYNVTMTSKYPVKVTRMENMRAFVCNATVPFIEASITVFPYTKFKPTVECVDNTAKHQQDEARLECKVRADPQLDEACFTYTDGLEEKIIKVDQKLGAMTMRKEGGEHADEYIYALIWDKTPENAFGEYMFKGKNGMGEVTDTAKLTMEGNPVVMKATSGCDPCGSTVACLLVALVSTLARLF